MTKVTWKGKEYSLFISVEEAHSLADSLLRVYDWEDIVGEDTHAIEKLYNFLSECE